MGRPSPPPESHRRSSQLLPLPGPNPDSGSRPPSTTRTEARRSLPSPPRASAPIQGVERPEPIRESTASFGHSPDGNGLGAEFDDIDEEGKGEGLPAYEAEAEGEDLDSLSQRPGGIEVEEERGSASLVSSVGGREAARDDQNAQAEAGDAGGQGGGLTRFGRWRGWVEKRAMERFDEENDREERRAARRQLPSAPAPPSYDSTLPPPPLAPARYLSPAAHPTALPNSSLLRLDYGSNFIPHSNVSINCALPILAGRLVVLGTSNGLRVLNTDDEDNPTRCIWYGLPVWELRIIDTANQVQQSSLAYHEAPQTTSNGSIVVLCGGVEDSSKCSRPKKASGTEVRIYNISSFISLARWSALQPKSFAGLDLTPLKDRAGGAASGGGKGKRKGKEVEWVMVDRTSLSLSGASLKSLSNALPDSSSEASGSELPLAWSRDYSLLPSTSVHKSQSGGGQGDVLLLATYTSQSRVFVAIGTSTHVIVYGTFPTASSSNEDGGCGLRFNASRTFYIPAQPTSLSFLQLPANDLPPTSEVEDDTASLFSYDDRASVRSGSTNGNSMSNGHGHGQSTFEAPPPIESEGGLPSLGMYVSFGSKACLIRVADSAVLDFKLKKSHSGSGGKGDWGNLDTLKLDGGGEVYVLTRGKETFLFSAPFEIPSHFNTPLATVLWPESPSSLSASIDYTSSSSTASTAATATLEEVIVRLVATSFTGNLHVQQLTFSTGMGLSSSGRVKAKPFGSTGLGMLAKIVHVHGKGASENEEGGCFVRYKKAEKDWRVIKLEKQ